LITTNRYMAISPDVFCRRERRDAAFCHRLLIRPRRLIPPRSLAHAEHNFRTIRRHFSATISPTIFSRRRSRYGRRQDATPSSPICRTAIFQHSNADPAFQFHSRTSRGMTTCRRRWFRPQHGQPICIIPDGSMTPARLDSMRCAPPLYCSRHHRIAA
jgi:hypothetical protein